MSHHHHHHHHHHYHHRDIIIVQLEMTSKEQSSPGQCRRLTRRLGESFRLPLQFEPLRTVIRDAGHAHLSPGAENTAIDSPLTSIISHDVVTAMHHAASRLHKQAGRRLITGSRCYPAVLIIHRPRHRKVRARARIPHRESCGNAPDSSRETPARSL